MLDLDFAAQSLRISVPYLLAALGAVFSERGGVINIGLEGLLLAGAFAYAVVAYASGSPLGGVAAAILVGLLVASLHAWMTVGLHAEQIVSGLAINLLALGATGFGLELLYESASNSPRIPSIVSAEGRTGALGLIDALRHPITAAAILGVFVAHFVLYRTVFGVRLRSVGEHPEAAESVGISVRWVRTGGVLISGALAAVGGAYLASEQANFTDNMSAGRGYIALAAMIVGKWRPSAAAGAAVLFGMAEAFQIRLQSMGVALPPQLVQAIPYVLTLVVLCGFIGRARAPGAVGKPFNPER